MSSAQGRNRGAWSLRAKASVGAVGATSIYLLCLLFPQPFFSHSYAGGGFVIHSRDAFDARLDPALSAAMARLRQSEFYDADSLNAVFVTDSPSWHYFFNGPNTKGMARNSEIGNRIFVPMLDVDAGEVVHFDGRRFPLTPILAHEVTHTYMQDELGVLAVWRLPFWLREGYGEYIAARDPRTLRERVRRLELAGGPTISVAGGYEVPRAYFEAGLLWEYLLDVRSMTARTVLSGEWDADVLVEEMGRWSKAGTAQESG